MRRITYELVLGFVMLFAIGISGAVTTSQKTGKSGGSVSPLTAKGDLYTRSASADCRLAVGTDGQLVSADSTQACGVKYITASGTGSVTSAGLITDSTTSAIFANTTNAVTGSPITAAGSVTLTFSTQVKNLVLAGPATGANAAPTYRLLVGADLPVPSATTLGGIQSALPVSHQFINSISILGVPALSQPAFSDLSGSATAAQLPNPSASTLGGVQSVAAVANNFVTAISVAGVPAQAQPAFTNLSGSVAAGQMPAHTGDVTTVAGAVATTVAKIAGTTVSGTTGSGNVVFSTAPTIDSAVITTSMKFSNYHLEPCETNAGNTSTALTLDLSTCASQKATATANVTFTFSNPVSGGSYVFHLVQDATGSRSYTWPAAVKWSGGTAPAGSGASKQDIVSCYYDGTNYFCTSSLNY